MGKHKTHKQLSITIPIHLYEWVENECDDKLISRSRLISECLRDCKFINSTIIVDDELGDKLKIVKGKK